MTREKFFSCGVAVGGSWFFLVSLYHDLFKWTPTAAVVELLMQSKRLKIGFMELLATK